MELKNIAAALSKAQGQLHQPKKDKKGFHDNMYADLASVLAAIKQPFADNGLSYIQIPTCTPNEVTVTTILYHLSGESITSVTTLPAKIIDPQKAGGAITYARRYALNAMVGIAGEDDDDGAVASGLYKKPQQQQHNNNNQKDNSWRRELADALEQRKIPKDKWAEIAKVMKDKPISDLDDYLKGTLK